MDLSKSERIRLQREAASGDARAAMRLWLYHSLELHDERSGDLWLRRAAELGHAPAQWNLGYSIKEAGSLPGKFGRTPQAAVKKLLEAAARTEGVAAYELACAYEDGYFGEPNPAKARDYYAHGARLNYRMCWARLADYYRRGLAGPRDEAEAYYWISLEARCVDPNSFAGKQTWKDREEVAQHLSLALLERAWQRIDAFMADVAAEKVTLDSPPFLHGMIDPKLEAAGRESSQQREDEHRKRLKSEKA